MRIFTIVLRTLMGLIFLFASVAYLFKLITPPPVEGAMKTFNEGLEASVYLLPTVKIVELVCGLAFVTGRYVTLAAVMITPIIVNILLVHVFLDPSGLPIALLLVVANGFVVHRRWDNYKSLLQA